MRFDPGQQRFDIGPRGAVAAQQTMLAQQPDIAGARHRIARQIRHVVRIGEALGALSGKSQALGLGKADQIEVKAKNLQLAQLKPEQLFVPAGIQA